MRCQAQDDRALLHFHPINPKEVAEVAELMELRHFLERLVEPPVDLLAKEIQWLVVIDHHEARIFRPEMHASVPQNILPHEPGDFFRHAHISKDFSRGQEKPDPNSFFEPVARALAERASSRLLAVVKIRATRWFNLSRG